MQIYLWVAIILLNVVSIAYCIKISIEFNKLVDENIELLQDNIRLKLENNEYEQIIDTLLQSNLGMKTNADMQTVKKPGRPRKTDK